MNIHLLMVLLMVNPRGPMVKNPSPCGPWAYEIRQLYETWPPDLNNCWGQIFLGADNSSQNSIKFYEGKSYRIFQCLELSDHGENCNTSQIHRCPWTQLRSFLLFCMPPWNRHKKQETVVPKMLQMPATKKLPPRICWASWMLRTMPGDGQNIPEELRNSKNIAKAREWVEQIGAPDEYGNMGSKKVGDPLFKGPKGDSTRPLRPWPPSWSSEKKAS